MFLTRYYGYKEQSQTQIKLNALKGKGRFLSILFFYSFTELLFASNSGVDDADEKPSKMRKIDNSNTGSSSLFSMPQVSSSDIKHDFIPIGTGDAFVYKGTWKGQSVAIKKPRPENIRKTNVISDFEQEARLMWKCKSPNVIKLMGICKEPEKCSLVLELMSCDLQGWLNKPISTKNKNHIAWRIAKDIANGLHDIHRQGILHCDLNSRNILLDEHNSAKIADFGLARHKNHVPDKRPGRPGYCAPELFSSTPKTSPASDIYSYGMVLWRICIENDVFGGTNLRESDFEKEPFRGDSDEKAVGDAVINGTREDIPLNCPPEWKSIIEDCWKPNPEERPTAADIIGRLDNVTRY